DERRLGSRPPPDDDALPTSARRRVGHRVTWRHLAVGRCRGAAVQEKLLALRIGNQLELQVTSGSGRRTVYFTVWSVSSVSFKFRPPDGSAIGGGVEASSSILESKVEIHDVGAGREPRADRGPAFAIVGAAVDLCVGGDIDRLWRRRPVDR